MNDRLAREPAAPPTPPPPSSDREPALAARVRELEHRCTGLEEALRQSEARLRALDNAPFAIALISIPDATLVTVNDAFLALFELTREEAIGKTSVELGISTPQAQAETAALLRERSVRDLELRRWARSGEERVLMLNLDAVSVGAEQYLLATIQDITKRTHAEAALRQSERRLQRVANIPGVGVLTWALPSGVLLDANDAFLDMFGYTREEVRSGALTWRVMTPPEFVEESERQLAIYEQTGRIGPYEKQYIRKDGLRSWMLFAGASLGDGTLIEYCIDVSDRKRAEAALREAKEAAEKANRVKTQFLSTLSHELRTPLTAVIGLSELMELEVVGPTNERQKEYLARIKAGAWHLVSIIDEILTFSRTEAGKETVRLDPTDVAEIARSVVELLRDQALSRGLQLTLRGAAAPLVALTDGGKVRQIVVNLVGNALRYTAVGSVDVVLEAGEDTLELRVRDTGPGIPPERLVDIFEPFVQLDGSMTREHGGTGLGLTICRRLARLLGGDVTVESTLGVGSTFTVRLPRHPPADGPRA